MSFEYQEDSEFQNWYCSELVLFSPTLPQPLPHLCVGVRYHNMPPSRPRAASNEHVPEYAPCWGAELHGGVGCLPHFVPGKLHFKNNFCDNCRDCVMVPISQVCEVRARVA